MHYLQSVKTIMLKITKILITGIFQGRDLPLLPTRGSQKNTETALFKLSSAVYNALLNDPILMKS